MKVAIQGQAGSFHHQAAEMLFPGETLELVCCNHFKDVFDALSKGIVDHGVVAVENNIYGSINDTYRLLMEHNTWTSRDISLKIQQQLIGPEAVNLDELREADDVVVTSQAPALAQVEQWLEKNLPNAHREESNDTAESVIQSVKLKNPHHLAIASKRAAVLHNGTIVAKDIQDDPHNYTRFITISRGRESTPHPTHASLILITDHSPGALIRALKVFADARSNLAKLDSHPIPGDKRHYAFYIDCEIPAEGMQTILEKLVLEKCEYKLLGESTTFLEA